MLQRYHRYTTIKSYHQHFKPGVCSGIPSGGVTGDGLEGVDLKLLVRHYETHNDNISRTVPTWNSVTVGATCPTHTFLLLLSYSGMPLPYFLY
jgi:hypothetical protein